MTLPTFTAPPQPPGPNDVGTVFGQKSYVFIGWMYEKFGPELAAFVAAANLIAEEIAAGQLAAATSATTAGDAATTAAARAAEAVAAALDAATSKTSAANSATAAAVAKAAAEVARDAALAAAADLFITANTTIYVRPNGSDANDGTANDAAHAKLTIAGALASIAKKMITQAALVTIQCADGTYVLPATIGFDHPNGDRIQLLGNTSAETTLAIVAIDTVAKTISVAGDYTAQLLSGDIFGLTGSTTAGLPGGYAASGVSYTGGNTVIACSAEAIASAVVGGGSIVIKPCNRCILSCNAGVTGITTTKSMSMVNGFRINSAGGTASGLLLQGVVSAVGSKMIINGFTYGIQAANNALASVLGGVVKGCGTGLIAAGGGKLQVYSPGVILDSCSIGSKAQNGGLVYLQTRVERNLTTQASPAIGTMGGSLNLVTTATI